MYSPYYYYFYIRSDKDLSVTVTIDKITHFLNGLNEIKRKDRINYENNNAFPWLNICLINARSYCSWSSKDNIEDVNLISIEGSTHRNKDNDIDDSRYHDYIKLLTTIAAYLNWELVVDETEDGEEVKILYCPRTK